MDVIYNANTLIDNMDFWIFIRGTEPMMLVELNQTLEKEITTWGKRKPYGSPPPELSEIEICVSSFEDFAVPDGSIYTVIARCSIFSVF